MLERSGKTDKGNLIPDDVIKSPYGRLGLSIQKSL